MITMSISLKSFDFLLSQKEPTNVTDITFLFLKRVLNRSFFNFFLSLIVKIDII